MSSDEKLTPERAVRLLHAKVGELEQRVLDRQVPSILDLTADIALIAQLLADHIEASIPVRMIDIEEYEAIDDANVREYTESQRRHFQCGPECSERHTYSDGCALFVPQ